MRRPEVEPNTSGERLLLSLEAVRLWVRIIFPALLLLLSSCTTQKYDEVFPRVVDATRSADRTAALEQEWKVSFDRGCAGAVEATIAAQPWSRLVSLRILGKVTLFAALLGTVLQWAFSLFLRGALRGNVTDLVLRGIEVSRDRSQTSEGSK